jgi:hypothetical protein
LSSHVTSPSRCALCPLTSTNASNELLLADQVVVSRVELLEEPFPPETVLVEEENEVFQRDLPGNRTQGKVLEDQLQDTNLLITHWVDEGIHCAEAAAERLIRL